MTRISSNFTVPNKAALADDVQKTLVSVLKIPERDRLITIDENLKGFFQPPDTSGNYMLVELSMFGGRTRETKRALHKALADMAEKHGVKKENVRIVVYDVDKDNWGIRGGRMASDVDLGFKVDV